MFKTMTTGLAMGIVFGTIAGAFSMYLYLKDKEPDIGSQKAQGCIVDGTIRHSDGSIENNWVCFDPNE